MQQKNFLPLLLIAFLAVAWLLAQQRSDSFSFGEVQPLGSPPLDSMHQRLVDRFEAYLQEAWRQEAVPALAIAIVKDSQVIFQQAWGVRSVEDSVPVDIHTRFRLASLSKGFAPVLAGIFVEKGQLHWEDPIMQYVPDFRLKDPVQTREVNLEHVLSHTTGLPRHTYSNLINMGKPYPEILPMLAGVQSAHPPGVYYNYQNVAYCLVGDVLEKIAGESYGELLTRRLFRPAGMEDASVGFTAMDTAGNVAWPHGPDDQGYHRLPLEPQWYEVAPAAGVNASIADMSRWLLLLIGQYPEIISEETLEKVFTPFVPVSPRESNMRAWRNGLAAAWYALGWRVLDYQGQRIIYHGGFVNGYRTEIAFDRERKIGVVVLNNSYASFMAGCMPTFFDLYRETVGLGDSADSLDFKPDTVSSE